MGNSFLDLAYDVLTQSPTPLTYQQIWEAAVKSGKSSRIESTGKTPWQSLGSRVYVEVRDNPDSRIIKIGARPARFWLRERQAELPAGMFQKLDKEDSKSVEMKAQYIERDLHPLLAYFAYANSNFNRGRSILTKTIEHTKSSRSGYNEWIHPDMVGFYLPLEDWREDVLELNRLTDNNALKLFSFEIKKSLSKANYREAYFQAVSNSSWAHEGYLVAAHILQDDDFLAEIERLASSFGIGIIHLDPADLDASMILYPARVRESLDWDTINKLCEQNEDFAKLIQDVKIDFSSKRVHRSEYDDELQDIDAYVRNKLRIRSATQQ
jgi:hypothetical protein